MMEKRLRRNSLRYTGYDYSQAGAIFVTISTHQNQRLFGTIEDGQLFLSPAGTFVRDCWLRLSERFPDIIIDEHVVMPDHLHGILMTGTDPQYAGVPTSIGFAVRSFKNSVLAGWRDGIATSGWPRYERRLWHRDSFDRIIRNENEMRAYRDYMESNPARWETRHGLSRR
jgi:putative transposase